MQPGSWSANRRRHDWQRWTCILRQSALRSIHQSHTPASPRHVTECNVRRVRSHARGGRSWCPSWSRTASADGTDPAFPRTRKRKQALRDWAGLRRLRRALVTPCHAPCGCGRSGAMRVPPFDCGRGVHLRDRAPSPGPGPITHREWSIAGHVTPSRLCAVAGSARFVLGSSSEQPVRCAADSPASLVARVARCDRTGCRVHGRRVTPVALPEASTCLVHGRQAMPSCAGRRCARVAARMVRA
jgi:hypothetical protein